jgi:hypothetical protein
MEALEFVNYDVIDMISMPSGSRQARLICVLLYRTMAYDTGARSTARRAIDNSAAIVYVHIETLGGVRDSAMVANRARAFTNAGKPI